MEDHSLRVFENRVCRNIFLLKREEVTGDWRSILLPNTRACSKFLELAARPESSK
jgi:hypothetical protein